MQTNDLLKISVVICSYNRAAYLPEALQSLYHQTVGKDQYEVIIVDNNSTDNTKEICLDFIKNHPYAQFCYVEEKKQGASFARNAGGRLAKYPLLCFVDDDAVATENYIENIQLFFKTHPKADALGGRIQPRYIPEKPKWMSKYISVDAEMDYSKNITLYKGGRYPYEPNMIVYTKDFIDIGGFSESILGVIGKLRVTGEGKEFFYRLMDKGKQVYYDPKVIVYHIVEAKKLTPSYLYNVASGAGRGERLRVLAISKTAYYKKIAEYILKIGAAVLLGIKYLFEGQPQKTMPIIKYRIDFLRGLLEPINYETAKK